MFCRFKKDTNHKSELLDYCDGEAFQSHPLFSLHANSLQIMLYFDELEVANPLGSKAKIHKLGTVYMLNSIVRGYRGFFRVQACSNSQ